MSMTVPPPAACCATDCTASPKLVVVFVNDGQLGIRRPAFYCSAHARLVRDAFEVVSCEPVGAVLSSEPGDAGMAPHNRGGEL